MFSKASPLLILFCLLQFASAQFFFDQMFGGGGNQHHQQQQQQQRASGESQWAAHADHTSCSQYLCPTTLACVATPVDCPCPSPEDIKCMIPDGEDDGSTVVCARGQADCKHIEKLMNPGWAKKS